MLQPLRFLGLATLVLFVHSALVVAQNPTPIFQAKQQEFGSTVRKVAGRVTVAGQFRNTAFLQDASGGIAIFNNQFRIGVQPGDSVVIENGTLTEFQPASGQPGTGLTQLTGENLGFTVVPVSRLEPTARNVTISRLAGSTGEEFEGVLVRIRNVRILQTGTFQGETTYTIQDENGSDLDLRLDGGTEIATNLLPIPQGSIDVIGVVSQFRGAYQIQPRFATDVSLPPVERDTVSRSRTLDLSTWNVAWLGADSTRGPRDKNRQFRSVRQVIDSIKGDVVALQEVLSREALSRISDSLSGQWSGIIAEDVPSIQKLAYVYNTATITPVSHSLTIVGAGDAWAGGRFPYRLTFRANIAGQQHTVTAFNIHAKATDSATAVNDYNRRKNDFLTFANYLNDFYADSTVVILGDFNDIANGSIVDPNFESPLLPFLTNTARWNMITKPLEDRGLSTYIGFRRSFLDHIVISQNLTPRVHRAYIEAPTAYLSSYTATVSDHVPVTLRILADQPSTSVNDAGITSNGFNMRVAPTPLSQGGTVELTIEQSGYLVVDMIDQLGQRVAVLTEEFAEAASTRIIPFDSQSLSAGRYVIRANQGSSMSTIPVIVVR